MKKYLILPLLFVAFLANAQPIILSDSAQISLLTAEPSPPVYARWGHTAIRVLDKKNKIDWAYNYGILQILTVSLLNKTPVNQLFNQFEYQNVKEHNYNILIFN